MRCGCLAWVCQRCHADHEPGFRHLRGVCGTLPHKYKSSDRNRRAAIRRGRRGLLLCRDDAADLRPGGAASIQDATCAKPGPDRLHVRARCARMGASAQLAPLGTAQEFQRNWAAARKEPEHVRKIPFEAKRSWEIVVELARVAAIAAEARIVMVLLLIQQRLVKEDPMWSLRLWVGVLGRRGVHDDASFFLRRRIRERRLTRLQRHPKDAIPRPARKSPPGPAAPVFLPATLRQS